MFVRYDTPNEHGELRRDRNEQFEQPSPELIIPEAGQHLWDWYFDLSAGVGRITDGVCLPIPWTELQAWANVSGIIVRAHEYDILRAMDASFCEETNKELQAFHERLRERQKTGGAGDG